MSDLEEDLSHPRILCLHGGGVNAEVFRLQMRAIIASLKPYFRFVFADAPFLCDAGPGIVPVYESFGPFRRWFRWQEDQPSIDDDSAIEEIKYSLNTAMERDRGSGPFVAVMGFSQGAKLAASLLYEQQLRKEAPQSGEPETDFRFGILLAGRSPLISLSELSADLGLGSVGGIPGATEFKALEDNRRLMLPTIHVHGLKDPGLELHRQLLKNYCDPSSISLVEWDGEHRVPVQTIDVVAVTSQIVSLAKLTGVLMDKSV